MNYFDEIKNQELKEYFNILCDRFPDFLNDYIFTDALQRLAKIGQFCGCDYTKLHSPKFWFSRLDHSVACALMTWNFTKDKAQTLAALFHDLGTPAFSHCIDFLLEDSIKQESSEKNIASILSESKEIIELLKRDGFFMSDVSETKKFTIIENKKPKLCVDRLEGVLHTALIWQHFWPLSNIKTVYQNIEVLKNEKGEDEIGFVSIQKAELFFDAVFKYSMALQQNEDKFVMKFTADILKKLIEREVLIIEDLYQKSEKQIIELISNQIDLNHMWEMFQTCTELKRSNEKPDGHYFVSVESKKRYVDPLVLIGEIPQRLSTVSADCRFLLERYFEFEDSKYSFVEKI